MFPKCSLNVAGLMNTLAHTQQLDMSALELESADHGHTSNIPSDQVIYPRTK
jgi:hypothetical protein